MKHTSGPKPRVRVIGESKIENSGIMTKSTNSVVFVMENLGNLANLGNLGNLDDIGKDNLLGGGS